MAAGAILSAPRGNLSNFNTLRQRWPNAFRRDDDAPDAVRRQHPRIGWQPPSRVEQDARRTWARDAPDGELRIIGHRRADADQHRIHQCAQPVEMCQPGGAIDVFGMSGHRRDPAIDRLADLSDDNEVVDGALAQGPEAALPGLRQRTGSGSKIAWNLEPVKRVTAGVIRLDLVGHVFTADFTSNGKMRGRNTMFFGD